MKATLLTLGVAFGATFVVGCGQRPPQAAGGGRATPSTGLQPQAKRPQPPPRDSLAEFEGGAARPGGTAADPADADSINPEVISLRDRFSAVAGQYAEAPSHRPGRRPIEPSKQAEVPYQPEVVPVPALPRDNAVRREPDIFRPNEAPPAEAREAEPAAARPKVSPRPIVTNPNVADPAADKVGWTTADDRPTGPAGTSKPPTPPKAPAQPAVEPNPAVVPPPVPPVAKPVESPTKVSVTTDADVLSRAAQRSRDNPQDVTAHVREQLLRLALDEQAPGVGAFAGLTPENRDVATALVDGLANWLAKAQSDPNQLTSQQVAPILEMSDRLRALAELSIPTLSLCSKVTGFGVYEPLPTTFRSGQDIPLIVYSEVANFSSRVNAAKLWETKLSMGAVLYTESGVAIWNSKNEVPADVSRNRRHDFFVVKRMTLPRNMAPGKYILKVTIVDEQANRMAENSVAITMLTQ